MNYPGGEPVGTIFSREDLTADLEGNKLGDFDVNGHGTACAGVAAGNGAALETAKRKNDANNKLANMNYSGVAPDADLIGVRIANTVADTIQNGWLLPAACSWIDSQAGQRPCVISCSFGSRSGGRDGFLIEERWLTQRFPETTRGRMLFIAAGNEGANAAHGQTSFTRDDKGKLTFDLKAGKKAEIEIYLDAEKGGSLDPEKIKVTLDAGTIGSLSKEVHGLSKSVIVTVTLQSGGSLSITTEENVSVQADAYMTVGSDPETDEPFGAFTGGCVKNAKQLGAPAATASAFTIGSYDFSNFWLAPTGFREFTDMKVGPISSYSNAGFLRKNSPAVKPEMVAPGQWHIAAASQASRERILATAKEKQKVPHLDSTLMYRLHNGTSAATPYAAGIAALALQKNPMLSAKQYRALLNGNLSRTAETGDLPNVLWGYGKLDLAAVKKLLTAVETP